MDLFLVHKPCGVIFVMRQLTVSDSTSPVPRPARVPDLVPLQPDGVLHRALDGPAAACRRGREEESAKCRLRGHPKIPQ